MSAGTGAGPAVSQQEERRRGCGARGLFGLGRSLGRLGELWRGKPGGGSLGLGRLRPGREQLALFLLVFFISFSKSFFQKSFEQNK
jgi:hypothetical protein